MNVRFLVTLAFASLGLATPAFSMDRWEALSMIESGNNDRAIGAVGEVSRYQIRPEFWPGGNPQNPQVALTVAQKTMQSRLNQFVRRHQRQPTDLEFYILWNAPWQADHPSAIVKERAQRFANLVQS
ncbi:MAG: hypothetical protein ACLQAH_03685 [Limisphaerales bacterium]